VIDKSKLKHMSDPFQPECLLNLQSWIQFHESNETSFGSNFTNETRNGHGIGMRSIKKCPMIIYCLMKYRNTGIPWYFMTSSIVYNFRKNPTVRIICSALTNSLCHIPVC